jgi:oligosaccharide repeat unit polymerase
MSTIALTTTPDRNDLAAAIRMFQLLIVVCLAGMGWLLPELHVRAEDIIQTQCWGIVVFFIWTVWSWHSLTRVVFDWYLIFVTAAYVFNGGQAFLEVLRLNEQGLLDNEFSAESLMKTLYLVQLSLMALHMGALDGLGRFSKHGNRRINDSTTPQMLTSLRLVGFAMLLVGIPFTAMLLREAISIVLSEGYFSLYQQKAPTGVGAGPRVLASYIIPGVLFLLAASRGSGSTQFFCVAVVVIFACVNTFVGVRHEAAAFMLAFAWLWDRRVRPLNFPLLLSVSAVILLVVFPLVAATRNFRGSDRASIGYLVEELGSINNPAISAVREMGGTMMTVAHTINLVPSSHEYEMGASYFYAMFTLFPNFFWELHPTIARKIPSSWLIWEVDPYTAAEGGGLGYSFIAEAFLNFGWLGTPLMMVVGGYLIGSSVRWADHNRRADRIAALASAGCFLLFYVRAELAVIMRGVVWYTCIPYVAVTILTHAQHAIGHYVQPAAHSSK